jgi:hypothetical protein
LVKRPFLGEVLRGQAGQGRAERQQQPICLIKRMLFLGQFVWQLGPSSRRAPVSSGQALNFFFGTNDTTLCLDRRCRLFEATRIALTSKPYLAASSSRTRRTSSTMGSLDMSYSPISSSGVQMTGHSHACSRQMKARDLAIHRIRNVHAIPGYQEIHSVHGCDGDVRSVGRSLPRDFAGDQNTGR